MSRLMVSVWLIWLISMVPVMSQASTQSALVYGYPDVSVWTTQRDADGQLKNPLLNVARELFRESGIEWQSRALPAKRLFRYLQDGVVPFSMLVRASGLEACCLFSERPVARTELRVFHRQTSPSVATKEDLAGKRIILIRGYSYGALGQYLRAPSNGVAIHEAASHAEAFLLFERGRGDYLIDYQGPAEEILAEHPVPDIVYDTYAELNVFLVLSRTYPHAPAMLKRLEATLTKLAGSRVARSE